MGHCAAISYGVAISMQNASQDSRVVCLDGDGSLLMHMGTMATIGSSNVEGAKRLIHIVFNNGAHDSVGGQHTAASHPRVSLAAAAAALGYQRVAKVSTEEELVAVMQEVVMHSNLGGPCFIEVACRRGARSDLGRPKGSPAESKVLLFTGCFRLSDNAFVQTGGVHVVSLSTKLKQRNRKGAAPFLKEFVLLSSQTTRHVI